MLRERKRESQKKGKDGGSTTWKGRDGESGDGPFFLFIPLISLCLKGDAEKEGGLPTARFLFCLGSGDDDVQRPADKAFSS